VVVDWKERKVVRKLTGDKTGISAPQLSSDGKRVLIKEFSGDRVEVWDVDSGQLIKHLRLSRAEAKEGEGTRLSSRDKYLAIPRPGGIVDLFDARDGTLVQTLRGQGVETHRIVFSPDDNWVAIGYRDGLVALWKIGSRDVWKMYRGHNGLITGIGFGERDDWLVAASTRGGVIVWDKNSGKIRNRLGTGLGGILSLAVSQDGTKMAAAGPAAILSWDPKTGKESPQIESHKGPVCAIAVCEKRNLLFTGSWDGTLKVWDRAKRHCLRTLRVDGTRICAVGLHQAEGTLVSVVKSGTVDMWNSETFAKNGQISGGVGRVAQASFCAKEPIVAMGGEEGVVVLEWRKKRVLRRFDIASSTVTALEISSDGSVVAMALDNGKTVICDVQKGWQRQLTEGSVVTALAFSKDGRYLFLGNEVGIECWELRSGGRVSRGGFGVRAIAVCSERERLAYVDTEGRIGVCQVNPGKITENNKVGWRGYQAVALLMVANDRVLAGYGETFVLLWDLSAGRDKR
jgi:WD40 repeat protein